MRSKVAGIVVAGHGVASGRSQTDRRFPDGTIRLQEPIFRARGLDLAAYFARPFTRGTINISCGEGIVAIKRPDFVFRGVAWTAQFPPENFFLCRCAVTHRGRDYRGLIYIPDPRTKPDHFQDRCVVEVIAETIPDLAIGDAVELIFDDDAIDIA